VTLDQLMHSV